jgi:alcohol dehydrogenase
MMSTCGLVLDRPAIAPLATATMKALTYTGHGQYELLRCPVPQVRESTDAIIKIEYTSICITDIDSIRGRVQSCEPGRILGHEGIGVVEQVGRHVGRFRAGDRVVISSVTRCGFCAQCQDMQYSLCRSGGWLLGNEIHGTQAEYVRVPFADQSLYHIPWGSAEEDMVMLSDVLPTVYECGMVNGRVRSESNVAITGSNVMGLAAVAAARLFVPHELIYIDDCEARLRRARTLGATVTLNRKRTKVAKEVRRLTGGLGVDTAIEATNTASGFSLCEAIAAHGGTVSNIGSHGVRFDLRLEKLWTRNVITTMGRVDGYSIPHLQRCIQDQAIDTKSLITHRMPFERILEAYQLFERANERNVLKILIET